ncbi:hypothetical protein [Pseudoxanthomonas wuyuanensis]|uniref:hypothetical protein n=1 Tax=Pseudoxanthomonas wuyuanensis TaxID=1073196 RepID=UPI001142F841|nr:hypothetical protein [Pseudoxanthomonas wuyuanensis]
MTKSRVLVVLGALLLVGGAVLFWPLVSGFFASGTCVSSGGSYDYIGDRCDFSQNHPFIPFYRAWSFWLAVAASVGGFYAVGRGVGRGAV